MGSSCYFLPEPHAGGVWMRWGSVLVLFLPPRISRGVCVYMRRGVSRIPQPRTVRGLVCRRRVVLLLLPRTPWSCCFPPEPHADQWESKSRGRACCPSFHTEPGTPPVWRRFFRSRPVSGSLPVRLQASLYCFSSVNSASGLVHLRKAWASLKFNLPKKASKKLRLYPPAIANLCGPELSV